LAQSIRETGLLQPIAVRRDPAGPGYIIVAGERRYRAHLLNNAATILARIVDMTPADIPVAQIVENLQRADLNPIEEGRAYQAVIDQTGWTSAELARRLGLKYPVKVDHQLSLLNLRPEYQSLVATGQLNRTQGFEMSRLPSHRQDDLFRAVKSGKATSKSAMRQFAAAAIEAERQTSFLDPESEPAKTDCQALSRLERRIDAALDVLGAGFDDGDIVAAKRVDPMKAETYAGKLALMQKALGQMERALRYSAAQLSFAAAA
jgi:ParB family chromosome partitioning protein